MGLGGICIDSSAGARGGRVQPWAQNPQGKTLGTGKAEYITAYQVFTANVYNSTPKTPGIHTLRASLSPVLSLLLTRRGAARGWCCCVLGEIVQRHRVHARQSAGERSLIASFLFRTRSLHSLCASLQRASRSSSPRMRCASTSGGWTTSSPTVR